MEAALGALEPLDSDQRLRAVTWLGQALGVNAIDPSSPMTPVATGAAGASAPAASKSTAEGKSAGGTPKQFLAQKNPKTDVERLTVLAYYLSKFRDVASFKTPELVDLNKEAAGRRFTNAPSTAKNAVRQNYLTGAGSRERQITHLGERVVEALPDREAVKAVLEEAPKPRKSPASLKNRKSKK